MLSQVKETCRHLLICISEDDSDLIASAASAVRRPGGAVTTSMSDFMAKVVISGRDSCPLKLAKQNVEVSTHAVSRKGCVILNNQLLGNSVQIPAACEIIQSYF